MLFSLQLACSTQLIHDLPVTRPTKKMSGPNGLEMSHLSLRNQKNTKRNFSDFALLEI